MDTSSTLSCMAAAGVAMDPVAAAAVVWHG
jgi:hypothetical protein